MDSPPSVRFSDSYQYSPLPNGHIRVLLLYPSIIYDGPIHIRLQVANLNAFTSVPKVFEETEYSENEVSVELASGGYEALSYC